MRISKAKCVLQLQTSFLEIPPDLRMRNRIEGGETVKKNKYGVAYTMPWQVGLTVKGGMEILEGATIICPNFVIGCAHTVQPKGTDKRTPEWKWNWKRFLKMEVIWGSSERWISKDAIRRDVKKMHAHEKFNNSAPVRFACEKLSIRLGPHLL